MRQSHRRDQMCSRQEGVVWDWHWGCLSDRACAVFVAAAVLVDGHRHLPGSSEHLLFTATCQDLLQTRVELRLNHHAFLTLADRNQGTAAEHEEFESLEHSVLFSQARNDGRTGLATSDRSTLTRHISMNLVRWAAHHQGPQGTLFRLVYLVYQARDQPPFIPTVYESLTRHMMHGFPAPVMDLVLPNHASSCCIEQR